MSRPSSSSRSAKSRASRRSRSAASKSPPSASSSIRPNSSPRTCRSRRFGRRSRSPPWTIPKARSTAARARSRSTPTISSPRPRPGTNVIVAYRNGGPLRVSDIGRAVDRSAGYDAGRLGRRQAQHIPGHLQAARRQRHRHRRQDHGRVAAHQGVDAAVDRYLHLERPHADDPRRRSATCNSRCCSPSRSW